MIKQAVWHITSILGTVALAAAFFWFADFILKNYPSVQGHGLGGNLLICLAALGCILAGARATSYAWHIVINRK